MEVRHSKRGGTQLRIVRDVIYKPGKVYWLLKSKLENTQDVHDFSNSGLSRQTPYLPGFLSYDAPTGTQEARCTGARFAPGPGRGRGVCRPRPANTPEVRPTLNLFILFPPMYHPARGCAALHCIPGVHRRKE